MRWYVVVAFAGYGTLLIWQSRLVIESGRAGVMAIPYLLVKLLVMLVALGYWDHDYCALLGGKIGTWIVLAGGLGLLREALSTLKPILLTPDHPPEIDNAVVAVSLLAAVVLPAVVLYFAGSVVLSHRCGS
jgi:hypothetical protein